MDTYYTVLGVPETATEEDIKTAYRKIALKYHPDKHAGLDDLFRKATEAYEILQNPQARKQYDSEIMPAVATPKSGLHRVRKGSDIRASVALTVEEVAQEVTKDILIKRQVHCGSCKGTGSSTGKNILCTSCNGTGIDMVSSVMGPQRFCSECKGFGTHPENSDCQVCTGTGLLLVEHLEHLKITRNFNPVTVIPGSGNCLRGGGIPGDLVISLNLEKTPSQTLRVEGKNIRGIIRISPAQAVLGDTLTLNVFGTTEKITIPAGTRPGAIIEKKEAGIAKGKTKGSLILKVYFNIPKKLSDTEKGLYKQLLKLQKE